MALILLSSANCHHPVQYYNRHDSQSSIRRLGTLRKSFVFLVNNVAPLAKAMLAILISIVPTRVFACFNASSSSTAALFHPKTFQVAKKRKSCCNLA